MVHASSNSSLLCSRWFCICSLFLLFFFFIFVVTGSFNLSSQFIRIVISENNPRVENLLRLLLKANLILWALGSNYRTQGDHK
jgi:hypothetical protein